MVPDLPNGSMRPVSLALAGRGPPHDDVPDCPYPNSHESFSDGAFKATRQS